MADVFISYKREDRVWAARLETRLKAAGYLVWWDTELLAGEHFDERINAELVAAICVVVIWSAASMRSNWVRSEARHALDRKPPALVACRVDDVALWVPFNSLQTADLRAPDGELHVVDGVARIVPPKQPAPYGSLLQTPPYLGAKPTELSVTLWGFWDRAAQGDADALVTIARQYRLGRKGLDKDESEAVRLYRIAAGTGNAMAQTHLGLMSDLGRGGLSENPHEAARLYRLAADQGIAIAQSALANMHMIGRGGVEKSSLEDVRLFRLAAQQGDEWAQHCLHELGETW